MANEFKEKHEPGIRQAAYDAVAAIPEVRQLLDAEPITVREVTRLQIDRGIVAMDLAVHAPELMPHPRARLLERGLVTRARLQHSAELEDGTVQVSVGYFGSRLQITLNFESTD